MQFIIRSFPIELVGIELVTLPPTCTLWVCVSLLAKIGNKKVMSKLIVDYSDLEQFCLCSSHTENIVQITHNVHLFELIPINNM